jgi:hypothetical protein
MKTYKIDPPHNSITCLACGMVSYLRADIQNRYCGHCHAFHDDLERQQKLKGNSPTFPVQTE